MSNPSKPKSFQQLLNELPGVAAKRTKQQAGRCPRCNAFQTAKLSFLVCMSCGYTVNLPETAAAFDRDKAELSKVDITNFTFGNWSNCFYCGEHPEERDHVIPHSMFSPLHTDGSKSGPRVMSCKSCNGMLGDSYFPTMEIRFLRVQALIRSRNQKLLHFPEWTKRELSEMGYSLKTMIKNNLLLQEIVERRLAWQESRESRILWTEAQDSARLRYPTNQWLQKFLTREHQ